MAEINDLNVTDASNTARFPENQTPGSVNNGARALEGLLARWHKDTNASVIATGSSNAYVVAANQTLSAYYDGLVIGFEANHSITGTATLNVDSVGAKTIKKHHDQNLASGDIESGQKVIVVFDSTADAWQMVSQLANGPITNAITQGTHTMWLPATEWYAATTSGATATQVETTAGRPDIKAFAFDATSDEFIQTGVAFPKSWDEGTITFQVFWSTSHTGTNGVAWALQAVARGDNGSIDVAFGTPVVVTDDAQSGAEEMLVTSVSSAVTIDAAAVDRVSFFQLFRDVSDANDDMTEDAWFLGLKIFFTIDAADDS